MNTRRLAGAAIADTRNLGTALHGHVRGSLSRVCRGVRGTFLWVVGTDRAMESFVALSLELAPPVRGDGIEPPTSRV